MTLLDPTSMRRLTDVISGGVEDTRSAQQIALILIRGIRDAQESAVDFIQLATLLNCKTSLQNHKSLCIR